MLWLKFTLVILILAIIVTSTTIIYNEIDKKRKNK